MLLRDGLLDGVRAALATAAGAGAEHAPLAAASERRLADLGATVARCALMLSADPAGEEQLQALVANALAASGGADLLVVDGSALYGAAAGEQALLACMQASLDATRAVASEAMLEQDGGLVVAIAPAPGAGEHTEAARAGLDALAGPTLSIEWLCRFTRASSVAASATGRLPRG